MSTPNCIVDSVALPPFKVLMSRQRRTRIARYAWLILRILCMANILLLIMLIVRALEKIDSLVYSPVQDVVEYKIKRFNTGFMDEDQTVFQGPPTDAMDEAWRDLYERGVSYLLPEEANRLKEPTIHATGSNVYIGGLDVFHQLHCLDMVRMAVYPARYPSGHHHTMHLKRSGSMAHPNISDAEHLRHCINSVRQSLMCSSDISVNLFYNPRKERRPFPRFDQLHTCRNFGKLREWAFARTTAVYTESSN
ncbi:ustYa family protein [Pleurotus pulmonarius]